ncbi:MAG TPA: transporter substrate-binding domain-containing protein [Burkholderiales bacterium]|nr:transporter substrate-binding domain-containing protein [Burkholderiales bacterium]
MHVRQFFVIKLIATMRCPSLLLPPLFVAAFLFPLSAIAADSAKVSTLVASQTKPWTGDLDGMLERRYIRVLVVPTKLQYWVERGQQTGATYEMLTAFEETLNKKYKLQKHVKTHVVFIPTSRDDLIPALKAGRGDIAAGGLTITDERLEEIDFSEPFARGVKEIVVTGPRSPKRLNSVDDLAGKEVFVRKSSSYWTHLEALNERFSDEGKKKIRLRAAPEELQDEDLLEMLNGGLVRLCVVDRYKALLWAEILPNIKAREDIVVNEGGEIGWMIRKNSPKLKFEVDAFAKMHGQGTAYGNTVIRKYIGSLKFVKPATSEAEMRKFAQTVEMFKKHSANYSMDYLLMMAQGYQESRLDQNAKSRVGAIGVMQVMPATGKDMKVGDITQIDPNIHAGVKYVHFVQKHFFEKEPMSELNKTLFAFASYNAGPGRVRQLRNEAQKHGLDPNIWFNNVELVAAEKVGPEPVTYVASIYKYYIAYKLAAEDLEERERIKTSSTR